RRGRRRVTVPRRHVLVHRQQLRRRRPPRPQPGRRVRRHRPPANGVAAHRGVGAGRNTVWPWGKGGPGTNAPRAKKQLSQSRFTGEGATLSSMQTGTTTTTTDSANVYPTGRTTAVPTTTRRSERVSTETKSAFKTTEFFVYILSVAGVLIASLA